jgi:uncharacterized protein (TIGR03000 family)
MRFHRSVLAGLSAAVVVACLCAADLSASGPRRVMPAPAYSYPAPIMPVWGYGPGYPMYNPYFGAAPGYGVLPLPAAAWDMIYKDQRMSVDPSQRVDQPRFRNTLSPAVPLMKSPEERELDLRRAKFEIAVPTTNAVVIFDGAKTTQAGMNRTYVTPPLTEDKVYSSTIEVQWTDEAGTRITRKKTFDFVAGETLRHRFAE